LRNSDCGLRIGGIRLDVGQRLERDPRAGVFK